MTKTTILVRSNTTCPPLAGCTIVHAPSRRVGHGRHRCPVAGLKLPGGRRIEWPQLRRVDVAESDGRIGDPSRGRGQRPVEEMGAAGRPSLSPAGEIDRFLVGRPARVYCHNAADRERDVGGLPRSSCSAPLRLCAQREHERLVYSTARHARTGCA